MIKSIRLPSLDVFRGITIALMIVVNSPGNNASYAWLMHSLWNGCSLADLVFPFFIVIVGISAVLSFSHFKLNLNTASSTGIINKVIRRTFWLFFVGLLLNAFPYHFNGTIRIMGVLQRIALCYFASSILFLTTTIRTQTILMIVLLIVYWILMTFYSPAGPLTMENNLVSYLDRLLLSSQHLYKPMFDPEGLLSTLPAIASVLLGNLLGAQLISSQSKQQTLYWILKMGLTLTFLGWLWSFEFPLNKALWSNSYVLWTGGLAYLVYACCYGMIELKNWKRWSMPFSFFGKHAMSVYVLHVVFLKIQAMIVMQNHQGEYVNLRMYITDVLFGYLTPQNASLAYALSYTLFWLLILRMMTLSKTIRSPLLLR